MIFALDPGQHSAIAWVSHKVPLEDLHIYVQTMSWESPVPEDAPPLHVYEGEMRMAEEIAEFLTSKTSRVRGNVTLLIEDFATRQMSKKRSFLSPVRVTISLLTILRATDLNVSVSLPPAGTMGSMDDERLKRLGLWVSGSKHERAALKHLAVYLRK